MALRAERTPRLLKKQFYYIVAPNFVIEIILSDWVGSLSKRSMDHQAEELEAVSMAFSGQEK